MPKALIVTYGNPLRSDDALALHAADQLEGRFSQNEVEILRLHQLGPELSETLSHFDFAIFIDAALPSAEIQPGEIHIREMSAANSLPDSSPRLSHSLSADTVVALSAKLYRATPEAFSVTVTGQNFEHGETLSPAVTATMPALVARIEGLVRNFLHDAASS